MKQKKDGRYINFYADDRLLTVFEQIALIQGKTKTRLLEEAMATRVREYCFNNGLADLNVTKSEGTYFGDECAIIEECSSRGSQTCVIEYKDGTLLEVLRKDVQLK